MPKSYEEIVNELLNQLPIAQRPSDEYIPGVIDNPTVDNDLLFNKQSLDTMMDPIRYQNMMNPSFMLDKLGPRTKYDDTQTPQQDERTEFRNIENAYRFSKTPAINPDFVDQNPSLNAGPLGPAYNQMPMAEPPTSRMPQLPQVPRQNDQQMQQLMDFYTSGGGVEI